MTTITINRVVVEQALEALEDAKALLNNKDRTTTMWFADEITALRAALEQEEPVAWMHRHIEDNVITHRPADLDRHPDRWTPLYKNPTPCETCQALARTVMMDQIGEA